MHMLWYQEFFRVFIFKTVSNNPEMERPFNYLRFELTRQSKILKRLMVILNSAECSSNVIQFEIRGFAHF